VQQSLDALVYEAVQIFLNSQDFVQLLYGRGVADLNQLIGFTKLSPSLPVYLLYCSGLRRAKLLFRGIGLK
jgi:hypothetical protein